MKAPVLYIERCITKNRLIDEFCYSAMLGAEQLGIKTKPFKTFREIPGDPTNIVVGSVESCARWLNTNGYGAPDAISLNTFDGLYGRPITTDSINVAYELVQHKEIFVKPAYEIKAFTGFVATDPCMLELFSNNYKGSVQIQPVLDIISEYRCYISNNTIIDMKHYLGDPLVFPNPDIILVAKERGDLLMYHSYVLDFGILSDGRTILIEPNDAWAIGNYGLDPQQYYLFIRNRWLQMTGIRKRMDYVF